jgi:hypothetical protein
MLQSTLAVIEFELSRLRTWHRVFLTLVMVFFPPLMFLILWHAGAMPVPEFAICVLNGMTCLLVMLLWATPNVYAELEGRSWVFVTSRPHGRLSILTGKYLISVLLSFFISWTGMSLCILATEPDSLIPGGASRSNLWLYFTGLLFLASVVYSAVFSFLGTIVQRRAMLFAFGYFMVIEVMAALVPAVIGKFAMTYHLLSLLIHWNGWLNSAEGEKLLELRYQANVAPHIEMASQFQLLYGLWPQWLNLLAIAAMTVTMLTLAATMIRSREYLTLDESQI